MSDKREPATPAPGAPCPKCGAWRDGERVISPPGGFVPCNHQWHGERPITTASPRSGLGARAEQFLCREENKTGLSRTSRWTWESACQFAEAYAAERVRQSRDARDGERWLLGEKYTEEINKLQHDFKSQEALAVSWEQQFLKATEQEITEREARERAEGALRTLATKLRAESFLIHDENGEYPAQRVVDLEEALAALKSSQEEGKL